MVLLEKDLQSLLDGLKKRSFRLIGPRLGPMAVILDEIEDVADLPRGYGDLQSAGSYRLVQTGTPARFRYTLGSESFKRYLLPAERPLFEARRTSAGFKVVPSPGAPDPMAWIGARPCELAAMAIFDRLLLEGPFPDPSYRKRRNDLFIVAVNCTHPSGTCFCASMKTGPEAVSGFDIALTEVAEAEPPFYLVTCGSEKGRAILAELPVRPASAREREDARRLLVAARGKMGRRLDMEGIQALFHHHFENPRWDRTAGRCLSCGNCTLVCPTCFCTTVNDTTDLEGRNARRVRQWDSCFTLDHAYMAGGSVRTGVKSRYRHWITHKLATSIDQFGVPACVGCGRCITWCPVGIDITEEVRFLRQSETGSGPC